MIWGNLSYIASRIPESTTVGQMCHIDRNVVIGNNCKIQGMVYIPPYTVIGDNVFIGPQVAFANDRNIDGTITGTTVERCVKIGMGCRIGAGLNIGHDSMIGMGSIVTKDIPANEVWYGTPARYIRKNKGNI